jgi:hypothetical protein
MGVSMMMVSIQGWALVAAAASFAPLFPAGGHATRPQAEPVCVAIALPELTGIDGDSTAVAASVRTLFVSYLTGPSLKAMALDARLASQAAEEARQKNCSKVLTVSMTRKAGGGRHSVVGALSQAGRTAAAYMPVSGVGGAIAYGTMVAGTEAVYTVATYTRAKDEMQLDYRVTSAEGAVILAPKTGKAKAKSDGEDIVTPLVAKAAEAVAAAVSK